MSEALASRARIARTNAKAIGRKVRMEVCRDRAIRNGLEGRLAGLLTGRQLGQAVGDVWADGYAAGWADAVRELR